MAHGDDLLRKPLAEAFFELRWKMEGGPPPVPFVDPQYKLLVGSLFDKLRNGGYAFHEQLDTARVPDELVPYLIQHRFRPADGGYPLVQVGPGVFAVNDTEGYSWATFKPRVVEAVGHLAEAYSGDLAPLSFTLRYLNAVPFDFDADDLFSYFRENLKVTIDYPAALFTEQPVERRPRSVNLQSTHVLTNPNGVVMVKFGSAEVFGNARLIWELQVQSAGNDVPPLTNLEPWLEQAHDVARAWFFTLIEGPLEAGFNA
jgi:uncharacterized protein (TIGR04255 family)